MGRMDDLENQISDLEDLIDRADASTRKKLKDVLESLKAHRNLKVSCSWCKGDGREPEKPREIRTSLDFIQPCRACKGKGYA